MMMNKSAARDGICIIVIIIAAMLLFPDFLVSARQTSGDHPFHLARINDLRTQLLSHGTLYGWSDRLFAGYPVNYVYPFGMDLLVIAMHASAFGLLSLSQAYGITVFLTYALGGISVYLLAASFFNRWVGLMAGLLMITDFGDYPDGGWRSMLKLGVVSSPLSISFTLLALHQLRMLLERPQWRHTGLLGLCMGASLLTHPVSLLNLPVSFMLLILCYAQSNHAVEWKNVRPKMLLASLLGGLSASAFLVPFLTNTASQARLGDQWKSTRELFESLLEWSLFPYMHMLPALAGAAGIALLLHDSRNPKKLFCGSIVLLLLLLALTDAGQWVLASLLPQHVPYIEFARFMLMAKPFWMIAASYGLYWMARHWAMRFARMRAQHATPRVPDVACMFILFTRLMLVIIALTAGTQLYDAVKNARRLSDTVTETRAQALAALNAFTDWANAQSARDPRFYRILVNSAGDYSVKVLDLPLYVHTPLIYNMVIPGMSFKYNLAATDPAALKALNVRYALFPEFQHAAAWYVPLKQFGHYTLYRFTQWQPEPADIVLAGGKIDAATGITVNRWDSDHVTLYSQNEAAGELLLHRSYFPRWQATLDGKPVILTPCALAGYDALCTPLHRGLYDLKFTPAWPETWAPWLSLMGIFASLSLSRKKADT